jgi:peptide/nickel transport system permease protein
MTVVNAPADQSIVARRALTGPAARMAAIRHALRRNPTILLGGFVLLVLVLSAVFAPLLAPADPIKTGFGTRVRPPSILGYDSGFLLGSDNLGRDVLSRLLYGGRVSLWVAVRGVVGAGIVGVALGLVSGYVGGWFDDVVQRIVDVQLSFPVIMLAIAFIAVVGTSDAAIVGVLIVSGWVIYARTVRASVLTVKHNEFIHAARALGAGSTRIIVRHLLPNVVAPIIVVATVQLASMLLLESGLSFLGLGIQPPTPSWGKMLAEGRDYLSSAWWLSTMPGIAISLAVLGANLLGDGVRDLLDPNLRGL